jgi:antitoxin component of RelBE/YafQ-DinJ toxin-antitoxin module
MKHALGGRRGQKLEICAYLTDNTISGMEADMAQQLADPSTLKASVEVLFQSYGMTLTTGIDALLKQVREQGESPMDEPDNEIWNPAEIRQASADLKAGRIEATDWEVIKARANAIQA